jgi:predicted nucleic acid-binding protein
MGALGCIHHGATEGLGDAFIAATSLCLRIPLLTYDTDYLPLAKEIQLLGIN